MANRPIWDMYPDGWRFGPVDPPEEPPFYCELCDTGSSHPGLCDKCREHLDAQDEEDWDGEPDYEAMDEARAEARGGPEYE